MDKIKVACPHCGQSLRCDEEDRGHKVKCPHCKHSLRVPSSSPVRSTSKNCRSAKQKYILAAGGLMLAAVMVTVGMLLVWPVRVHWPDRRPIGVLFLASNFHSSATNPRGWFNDPTLDVTGPDGAQRFRKALLDYTDRSLAILKRTGAQGVIVWDLEGEQFPHKTTFIGDPRLVGRLTPEMAPVVDEFFQRFRDAGLRVGVTIRPQQLVFDVAGQPRQTPVLNIKRTLLEKIDYAKAHWGCTLFYVDSTGGIRRPDEVWQLRSLAKQRPDILLIPEHHYLPYGAFTAPYVAMKKNDAAATSTWAQRLFPKSFQALDIGDAAGDWAKITIARSQGDILLFRAWTWSPECQLLEGFAQEKH